MTTVLKLQSKTLLNWFFMITSFIKVNILSVVYCANSETIVPKENFDSPKSAFGDKSWNASSPLESLEFEFLLDAILTYSLTMLFIVIFSQVWLRLSFIFPELKKTKPSVLEKYTFLKKINAYYELLTPEQLKTLRILYILLSLYASGGLFFILTRFWFVIKYTIFNKS